MREPLPYDVWAERLSAMIYAVAKEGGGRILLHRGGEDCDDAKRESCPCGPQILTIHPDGSVS